MIKMKSYKKNSELIRHHVRYKELHGADEIVWMNRSEHKKLHYRLRKEKKCNVSSKELAVISSKARGRTDASKEQIKLWKKSHLSTKRIDVGLGKNVRLRYIFVYNFVSQRISFLTRFEGTNGHKLPVFDHKP